MGKLYICTQLFNEVHTGILILLLLGCKDTMIKIPYKQAGNVTAMVIQLNIVPLATVARAILAQ